MTLFLGIDGGGTGCRAVVAAAEGPALGRGEAGAANIWTDPDGARASILAATRAALAAADRPCGLGDLRAVLGLAGANVGEGAERLAAELPFARTHVESDAVIALRGALGSVDGVTATIGTGSVFAVQRSGAIRVLGGWGFTLGDQGSGARMGRALLEAALLAHDGLCETTPLLAAVIAEAGGPAALVQVSRTAWPEDYGRHAPALIAADNAGDPAARAILAEAEGWIAASIDRLRDGAELPVCFLGGLGPVFAERLAGRYAGWIRPAAGTALDGALALSRRLG